MYETQISSKHCEKKNQFRQIILKKCKFRQRNVENTLISSKIVINAQILLKDQEKKYEFC